MIKKRTDYPTKPRAVNLDGDRLVQNGKNIIFYPSEKHGFDFTELKINSDHIFDLVPATFYGLLEDLAHGSEIGEKFSAEWDEFERREKDLNYGQWFFYSFRRDLVRFSSQEWHRLALLVRNSTLIRDPEFKMSWGEIRKAFENSVISIAGLSLGNNVAHAVSRDIRPSWMKLADHKTFRLSNANRVTLDYASFKRNKAVVTAEQIHSADPYMKISVFEEGIMETNVASFLCGDETIGEPKTSMLIDEIDDIEMKIKIREAARAYKIPVIMVTDIGSAVQLDVRRFDKNSALSLFPCVSDAIVSEIYERWKKNLGNQERFYEFFFAVVGPHALEISEFRRIVFKEDEIIFGGAPQLGSTAMAAGGIAAEAAARIILGHNTPDRMFIDKFTGKVIRQ